MTGIDQLVRITVVEDQNKALLNHANIQRQLRNSKVIDRPLNRICCKVLFRLGKHLVFWGTGLQRRFGNIAEAAV